MDARPELDDLAAPPNSEERLAPLRIEAGLYYRLHLEGAPFGPKHASSAPSVPEEVLANPEWIGHSRGFAEPRPGYSAFWSPHHLEAYIGDMHWETEGRRVILFRGTPVGQGYDGEPLVLPASERMEEEIDWDSFCARLELTPDGYGRWHEHTWGDGPDGPLADDGYRRLSDL